MTESTTSAACMTPNGRGAVATVRFLGDCGLIDGDPPLFRAANGSLVCGQSVGRVIFGQWGDREREDVVVCRVDKITLDIHCHGGDVAAERILSHLKSRGCRLLSWREMIERSQGGLAAELLETLSRASTLRTADILLEQQSGALKSAVESLLEGDAAGRCDALRSILRWATFGLHLSTPWNVVLFGRPNVGKSSLINALVGYSRSIVYEEPGTTRDVVTAETALDGWPIRLADTAGIRDEADVLEASGIERARRHLVTSDLRLLLLDTSRPAHPDDRRLLADWPDAILVAHKCDLPNVWERDLPDSALPVSSRTGAGLDQLAAQIVSKLVPAVPAAGTAIPVTPRQVELLQTALAALQARDEACCRDSLTAFLA